MNMNLESKFQEFRIWTMTLGRYSPPTVKRSLRRVRSFSRLLDAVEPRSIDGKEGETSWPLRVQ